MEISLNRLLYFMKETITMRMLVFATTCAACLLYATQAIAQKYVQIDNREIVVHSGDRGVSVRYSTYSDDSNLDDRFEAFELNLYKDFSRLNRELSSLNQRSGNRFVSQRNNVVSESYQSTSINVDASPVNLKIRPDRGTFFTGKVTIDGTVIENLSGSKETSINLSPYLDSGENTIEISGYYSPARSSVHVELSADNNIVSQETGGNGKLNQTLILDVH